MLPRPILDKPKKLSQLTPQVWLEKAMLCHPIGLPLRRTQIAHKQKLRSSTVMHYSHGLRSPMAMDRACFGTGGRWQWCSSAGGTKKRTGYNHLAIVLCFRRRQTGGLIMIIIILFLYLYYYFFYLLFIYYK